MFGPYIVLLGLLLIVVEHYVTSIYCMHNCVCVTWMKRLISLDLHVDSVPMSEIFIKLTIINSIHLSCIFHEYFMYTNVR